MLAMPLSTVSEILIRIGMGRLGRLGFEPAVRYERSRPGELVQVDVKKLGRIVGGAGWRFPGPPCIASHEPEEAALQTFAIDDGQARAQPPAVATL